MRDRHTTTSQVPAGLPPQLREDVVRAGYYPDLVCDVLEVAIAGEEVRNFLVHPETTFDRDEIRRHVTVLVLTNTRLVVAHADDHEAGAVAPEPLAAASTEAVSLRHIRSVVLTHSVANPAKYTSGTTPRELSLTVGWGGLNRIDLEPAGCADPECEADHGYTGATTSDDISVRLSAEAEGASAVGGAVGFARSLSAAVAAQARP